MREPEICVPLSRENVFFLEKFTPLTKLLHCCRQWREWQISPLVTDIDDGIVSVSWSGHLDYLVVAFWKAAEHFPHLLVDREQVHSDPLARISNKCQFQPSEFYFSRPASLSYDHVNQHIIAHAPHLDTPRAIWIASQCASCRERSFSGKLTPFTHTPVVK